MQFRAHFDHATREIMVTIIPETDPEVLNDPELGPDPIIAGISVTVAGDRGPVMRMPFYIHGGGYHTMCSRVGDGIYKVEY